MSQCHRHDTGRVVGQRRQCTTHDNLLGPSLTVHLKAVNSREPTAVVEDEGVEEEGVGGLGWAGARSHGQSRQLG